MNKNFLLISIFFICTNFVKAQEKSTVNTPIFAIGINTGPNFNSLRGDRFADKYKSNFNYYIGLSIAYKIDKHFSILTNLNYEKNAYKSEYRVGSIHFTGSYIVKDEIQFANLNIPVLMQYNLGVYNEFFINGGFFYNPILKVQNEMINSDTGNNESDLDFNELFKKKNFGLSLGIGMNFKYKEKDNISIEFRDDYGLSDIGATTLGDISTTKTNTLRLIVNWSLNL